MVEYWNDGTIGSGLRLVEPPVRKGKWDNGLLERFHLARKVFILNKKFLLKATFQYSIIPCARRKHHTSKTTINLNKLHNFRDI
jgi:hypothetical protein